MQSHLSPYKATPDSILDLIENRIKLSQGEPSLAEAEAVFLLNKDLSQTNTKGYQAIHLAEIYSFYKTFHWLLSKGASFRSQTFFGLSALDLAISLSDTSLIRHLLALCHPGTSAVLQTYRWHHLANLTLGLHDKTIMKMTDDIIQIDTYTQAKYLTPYERQAHRLFIKNGLFYQDRFTLFDTSGHTSHLKRNRIAFVINAQMDLSVFDHLHTKEVSDYLVHSSMNGLAPVFAAGEITVKNGRLVSLTDYSGHYQPTSENINNALHYFASRQVDMRLVKVHLRAPFQNDYAIPYTRIIHHSVKSYSYPASLFLQCMHYFLALKKAQNFSKFLLALQAIPQATRLSYLEKLEIKDIAKWAGDPDYLPYIRAKVNYPTVSKLDYFNGSFQAKFTRLDIHNTRHLYLLTEYIRYLIYKEETALLLKCLKTVHLRGVVFFDICLYSKNDLLLIDLFHFLKDACFNTFVPLEKLCIFFKALMELHESILEIFIKKLLADKRTAFYAFINQYHTRLPDTHWNVLFNTYPENMIDVIFARHSLNNMGFKDALSRRLSSHNWKILLSYISVDTLKSIVSETDVLECMLTYISENESWRVFIDLLSPEFVGEQLQKFSLHTKETRPSHAPWNKLQMAIVKLYIYLDEDLGSILTILDEMDSQDFMTKDEHYYLATYFKSQTSLNHTQGIKTATRLLYLKHIEMALIKGNAEALPDLASEFKSYFPTETASNPEWNFYLSALYFDLCWLKLNELLSPRSSNSARFFQNEKKTCLPYMQALTNKACSIQDKILWIREISEELMKHSSEVRFTISNLLKLSHDLNLSVNHSYSNYNEPRPFKKA